MIDELAELIAVTMIDNAINNGAKRHSWVLGIKIALNLLVLALIIGLIYVTFKYS